MHKFAFINKHFTKICFKERIVYLHRRKLNTKSKYLPVETMLAFSYLCIQLFQKVCSIYFQKMPKTLLTKYFLFITFTSSNAVLLFKTRKTKVQRVNKRWKSCKKNIFGSNEIQFRNVQKNTWALCNMKFSELWLRIFILNCVKRNSRACTKVMAKGHWEFVFIRNYNGKFLLFKMNSTITVFIWVNNLRANKFCLQTSTNQ